MKNIISILFVLVVSSSLRAEYGGYHIKFTLENVNGKISIGYAYVAEAYLNMDSLKNTEYLKRALDRSDKDWVHRDSLTYFKDRIRYEYKNVWDSLGEKQSIYTMANIAKISFKEIKSIKIDDMISQTTMIGIGTDLQLSDTSWIKKEPIKSFSYSGYLCSYQVYIHKKSSKVDEIIRQLEKKQNEIDTQETQEGNSDPDHQKGDFNDEELGKIIRKLGKYKVVIITECSC